MIGGNDIDEYFGVQRLIAVCVKEKRHLTVGKKYDVVDGSVTNNTRSYWIIFDNGEKNTISKKYFKELEEVRNDKLTELGI